MKRVKQISLDIEVDESIDGNRLAEEVAEFLESRYIVYGSCFLEDMTEEYKEYGWL